MSTTDGFSIFGVPAVPITPEVPEAPDAYTGHITRKLCAAAYVRPDRLAGARDRLTTVRARLMAQAKERLRIKPTPRATNPSGDDEPRAPSVVLGSDYAEWVHTRITSQTHRIPAHGVDQGTVLKVCDVATRQLRRRTATLIVVVLGALTTMLLKWLSFDMAVFVALVGCWATYMMDRYVSQRRMNSILDGDLPKAAAEPPSHALPYVREMRKGTPRDRFLGAGLQAWPQAAIGIDVESAPPGQEDETATPFIPHPARSTKSGEMADVLSAISKLGAQSAERKPMKPFTSAQLHAYVVKRLSNPAPSHDRSHPIPRTEIVGIAGISRKRWTTLDDTTWRGLNSLATNDGVSAAPEADIARRYIWARITKSNGELIVSVLVRFAYEGGFLRVTVQPHIMAPLNPAVDRLGPTDPRTVRWLCRAAMHSVGDVAAGISRLARRTPRPVPELGEDPGPVSLREVYSLRWIDDMHMNDDARYYVQMMQRRVFDYTETFLRDHNVDIAAYRQQATAIYNFGVMNGGTINGGAQAAPFSNDVQMS